MSDRHSFELRHSDFVIIAVHDIADLQGVVILAFQCFSVSAFRFRTFVGRKSELAPVDESSLAALPKVFFAL